MPFWNVNIKPESIRVLLGWILGHQAILVLIDVCNELYVGFKLQNFCHDKKKRRKGGIQIARGVTIHVVLFE